MIALGEHWIRKNRSIFSKIMNRASYTADNMGEVIRFLDHPARYDLDLTEFLFGRDRGSVIEKIRQTFLSLGSGEID